MTLGLGEVGFDEAAVDTVRGDADVVAAVPLVRGTIALADDPGETLQLFGVDLVAEEDIGALPRDNDRPPRDPRIWTIRAVSRHQAFRGGIESRSARRSRLATPAGLGARSSRGILGPGLAAALGGSSR